MKQVEHRTLVASAARTASGSELLENIGGFDEMVLELNVTAASGTSPTLDVIVEDTITGTNWRTNVTFAQKIAVGGEVKALSVPFSNKQRVSWTIGGTSPSFTFEVKAVLKG